jgi:ribosomal protein L29
MDEQKARVEDDSKIIGKLNSQIAELKEKDDKEKHRIMEQLSPLAEMEVKKYGQIEPWGIERKFIKAYIKEARSLGSEKIDNEKLKSLYMESHKKVREVLIESREEFFKSRDQYYCSERRAFITLNRDNRKTILDVYIGYLDRDLEIHKNHFMYMLGTFSSLSELITYEKKLGENIYETNNALDGISVAKYPHMEKYNDNHERFGIKKIKLIRQALLDSIEQNDVNTCQYLLTEYKPTGESNFNLDFQNEKGFRPIQLALSDEMAKVLLIHGAKAVTYTRPNPHREFSISDFHWHFLQNILIQERAVSAMEKKKLKKKIESLKHKLARINTAYNEQNTKSECLLDSIGKMDNDCYSLSEDIYITRGEIKYSIAEHNRSYKSITF